MLMKSLLYALPFLVLGLSHAETEISVLGRDNGGSTTSLGSITITAGIDDDTPSGSPITYVISDLDLDDTGGNNDSITVQFTASFTGSGNFETNSSGGGNWLAVDGGTESNFIDDPTESVTLAFDSFLLELNGSAADAGELTFDGFTGGEIGKSGGVVATDTFIINGEVITGITSNQFSLSDGTKDSITFAKGNVNLRAVAWEFGITHMPPVEAVTEVILADGASNTTDPNNQGSSSSGLLTCSQLVVDNTGVTSDPAIQKFTISGLDLNEGGGNNDEVVVSFNVTSPDEITTSGSAAAGWLADAGNQLSGDGQWLTVAFAGLSVNLDGGTDNGVGSFLGFRGATMGSWQDSNGSTTGEDVATINGEQFVSSGANQTLNLSDPTSDSLAFTYNTADGDLGSWRLLGTHFAIEVESYDKVPPPSGTPTIVSFDSSRYQIDAGEQITLSWETTGATTLSIDGGIGDVTSLTSDGSGSIQVASSPNSTYTLTVTGPEGSDTAELTLHSKPSKPNVLVVLVDDWGTEDTSVNFNLDSDGDPIVQVDPSSLGLPPFSQSNEIFHTPTLETLASQGSIFTRAYVSPVCSPTRMTFLTGQNSARHRGTNYHGGGGSKFNIKSPPNLDLTSSHRTIAEVFRDHGYRTIIAGKGHIGNDNLDSIHYDAPATDPADDFYGFQINVSATNRGQHGDCYSDADPAFKIKGSSASATAFMAEYQDKTYDDIDPVKYADQSWKDEPMYVTEALTIEMNERLEDSVKQGKPFFAYMSHFATHQPHQLDPRFADNPKYAGLTGNTLDVATMVEGVDRSTSDIIDQLEELGVAENTLIVFFGDNGSEVDPSPGGNLTTLGMSNPLRGQKGHRYEGGVRVPLIISWAKPDPSNPHQSTFPVNAGQKVHDLVAGQDFFPTLCAAAALPLPTTDDDGQPLVIDGHNLEDYLDGTAATSGVRRPQQLLIHFPTPHGGHNFFSALYQDEWKLIYNYNCSVLDENTEVPLGTYELYNIADDPYEADNRADPASPNHHPERVMDMARDLIDEIGLRTGEYPELQGVDAALDAIGLPSAAGDIHPVVLPVFPGVDLDGDGLDDTDEDTNRNGVVDPGETDFENANTDGDNVNDGEELALGLDPFDPNSAFTFTAESGLQPDGSVILTWPSIPGTSFSIEFGTHLDAWPLTIVSGHPADSGSTTTYHFPRPSEPRGFFRVLLD